MYLSSIFFVLFYLHNYYENCSAASIYFMDAERPVVSYINHVYVKAWTMTARRIMRNDPRHYFNTYMEILFPVTNDIRMDFYFYQFLTNRYRPSFVELHFGCCEFIDNDPIMGAQIKRNVRLLNVTCPYPPGKYNLTNMAIPYVPKNFPFQKGRIYLNVTKITNTGNASLARGYIDMEIKQWSDRKPRQ